MWSLQPLAWLWGQLKSGEGLWCAIAMAQPGPGWHQLPLEDELLPWHFTGGAGEGLGHNLYSFVCSPFKWLLGKLWSELL